MSKTNKEQAKKSPSAEAEERRVEAFKKRMEELSEMFQRAVEEGQR